MSQSAQETFPLPNFSIDLSHEICLVTGASGGLGRRFAQVLAAAGTSVVVASRRMSGLEQVASEIRSRGGRCEPVELDVTDADQIVAAVARAEEVFGTVTTLVNNAALSDTMSAQDMSVALIDQMISTNLRGPWILACEVARRLIAAGRPGRIVNISSIGSFHYSGKGAALYSTTKAGINRMTETLAVEWARHGINVTAIAPGALSSVMFEDAIRQVGDFTAQFHRERLGQPVQLDSTLLYLVAPVSECVTGTIVRVDDGQTHR